MGVRGLQQFVDRCCPEACVPVDLRERARHHAADHTTKPTLIVDGMACLRHWYSCKDWVCGGQWREYMASLKNWVDRFTSAGIRLVFFFDGVVEEKKIQEWVKRRQRVNRDVSDIFHHIKAHGEQPGGNSFILPSGLATFTPFALRRLGQEVFCSVEEADYEIARYARHHSCMGILGQDSDFIIFDSAPYFSVAKLRIDSLTTVLYDRQILCGAIGLTVAQLPLLACLLGNDVVSEERMKHVRNDAMATYRKTHPTTFSGASQAQMVLAVSRLVNALWDKEEEMLGLIPQSLTLSDPDRELLKKGVRSYVLPAQEALKQGDHVPSGSAFREYVSPEILKACAEKHIAAEGFMIYGVVCEGVVLCSNSLEDEKDNELLPQALVYKSCRQHIYSLLLHWRDASVGDPPAIREWFVYPGNPLKEPDYVHPVPLSLPCDQPSPDLLWFGTGSEVSSLRLVSFFSIFDCQEFAELYGAIEDSLLAALCLVTYIALQVAALSLEDVDAYLSQAVCLRLKSPQELQQIKLPVLSSRAVQLGSLYVRGLSHMLGANSASGCPLPGDALLPWNSFDGRLFHSTYLLAHGGTEAATLLDGDSSCLSLFLHLREKLTEACRRRGRVLQSRPETGWSSGGGGGWRENTGGHQSRGRWRERGEARPDQSRFENRESAQVREGHRRGGVTGGRQFNHLHHPQHADLQIASPRQPRGRPYRSRGAYRLAPRWSHPPAPGT